MQSFQQFATPSPLSIPFAHWQLLPENAGLSASVTASLYLHDTIVCGLHNGDILLLHRPIEDEDRLLHIKAHLLGHYAPIVSLKHLRLRAESGIESEEDDFLLALSKDGHLTKWSLRSGRCLQSSQKIISFRPYGMRTVKVGDSKADYEGGRFLTNTFVLIYGASAEITVLNAFTLLPSPMVWSRIADWPIPLPYQNGPDDCVHMLTVGENGSVESWTLRSASRSPTVVKNQDPPINLRREEWGRIITLAAECLDPKLAVVQEKGLSIWQKMNINEKGDEDWYIVYQKQFETDILDAQAHDANAISAWDSEGLVSLFLWKAEKREYVHYKFRLSSNKHGEEISSVIFPSDGMGKAVVFSTSFSGNTAAISKFNLDSFPLEQVGSENLFMNAALCATDEPSSMSDCLPSTCSAIFCGMLVFACGKALRAYTLASFLLSFHEPTREVEIPQCNGSIVLLKTVRLREYGSKAEREYLILGTSLGEIRIVEAPSFKVSSRLNISTVSLTSATKLPSDLGKRLRDTLLVTASDGTVAIIDVERARVMVVFPGHDHKDVVKFSTKAGKNLILLAYSDGVSREWECGDEDCGVLVAPTSHSNSKPGSREGINSDPAESESDKWRDIIIVDYWREDEDVFDVENLKVFSICDIPSKKGLPTAAVNLRNVLESLINVYESGRKGRGGVVRNNPALLNAKAVLAALLPYGRQLFEDALQLHEDEDFELNGRLIVNSLFPRRPRCPTMGQIGAGGNIALLSPHLMQSKADPQSLEAGVGGFVKISPTVTAIGQLCILSLIKVILDAEEKSEWFRKFADVVLVGRDESKGRPYGYIPLSLSVIAKFWLDPMPTVRGAARFILEAYVDGLTEEHKAGLVSYWKEFLPTKADSALIGVAKQIPRSVTILTYLLASNPGSDIFRELPTLLSESLEKMLDDPSPPYYRTLSAALLASNWLLFQAQFHDPIALLRTLILHPNTVLPLSQISTQNFPLLVSAYTTLLSNGTLTPTVQSLISVLNVNAPTSPVFVTLFSIYVKTLETAHHRTREELASETIGLAIFADKTYPTAAFEPGHSRLAFSVSRSNIVIYDLTKCTLAYRLDGHAGLAGSLTWGGEHKRYLAALDFEEGMVVVWRVSSGFLAGFMGREGDDGAMLVQPRGKWRVGKGAKGVSWNGEKAVIVRMEDGKEVNVNVA